MLLYVRAYTLSTSIQHFKRESYCAARNKSSSSSFQRALYFVFASEISSREYVFCCEGKLTVFSFPKDPVILDQWMRFVLPGYSWQRVWICQLHFSNYSFMNKNQYEIGFARRLKIEVETVPTLKPLKKHKFELSFKCLCFILNQSQIICSYEVCKARGRLSGNQ